MQLFQTATKLVDHFFAISVSESNNSVNCYFSYPPISESNNTLKNIVPFCFPSAQQSTDGGGGEEPVDGWKDPWYHDFVLTDEKGQKRFATCLKSRLFRVMPVDDNNAHNNDKPQMMDIGCLCLISNQPKFNTLRALLEEVFMCMMSDTSDSSAVEMLTWELIHQCIIPPPGGLRFNIQLPNTSTAIQLINSAPTEADLPCLDYSLLFLFETLSIAHVVDLFSMLLLEKSILLHSRSPTIITRTCEALLSFLYPLQWDLVYVPLVPEVLRDLTEAPTPFLLGGESRWVTNHQVSIDFSQQQQVILQENDEYEEEYKPGTFIKLDIDNDDLFDNHPERNYLRKRLPGRSALIEKLKSLLKRDMAPMNGGYRDLKEFDSKLSASTTASTSTSTNSDRNLEINIRRVFLDWFLTTFRSYRDFYREDCRFDDARWLMAFPDRDKDYYKAFIKTSMFRNFIDCRGPEADNSRLQDYFDILLSSTANNTQSTNTISSNSNLGISSNRRHSRMPTFGERFKAALIETETRNVQLKLLLSSPSQLSFDKKKEFGVFQCNLFQQFDRNKSFQRIHSQLTETLKQDNTQSSSILLCRAYLNEKMSRRYNVTDGKFLGHDQEYLGSALNDYLKAYSLLDAAFLRRQPAARIPFESKVNYFASKMAKETLEGILQQSGLTETFRTLTETAFKTPSKDITASTTTTSNTLTTKVNVLQHNNVTNRLVMNCSNVSSAHIDSVDWLNQDGSDENDYDDKLTPDNLSQSIRRLIDSPIDLSIKLADMISSMIRIISDPPLSFGSNNIFITNNNNNSSSSNNNISTLQRTRANFSSMGNLKSLNPVLDIMTNNDASNSSGNSNDDFILRDAKRLPSIKSMPTFEQFKQTILALRFVNLEDTLQSDEEKICFWLNIRNTLFLHVYVEFGPPMSFQQQTTFLHHRPVYNVGGHLFSVNEITFGILKHSFPLPAHFNVRSTTNPLPTSSTTSNSATLLNTNNTLVCILSLNGRQETTVLESSQSTSTNTTNTNTSSNKVPLKFIGTDARSKFKLLNACNLVDFCLLDGTPSGPRMRVYQLDNIYSQLSAEACDYLTKHITATMNNNTGHSTSTNTAIHNIASILGGGGGGKRKKRVFSVPQYLIWHSKDFIPPSVSEQPTAEQVLAFAHYFCLLNNTTPSGFSEVIRQEQLLKLPAANIHTHTQPLATQVLQCIQLCQFSCDHNGTRLLSIKVKEHSWDFELRSSTTLLD